MIRIQDLTPTDGNVILEPIKPEAAVALPESYVDPNMKGRIVAVAENVPLKVGQIAFLHPGIGNIMPLKINLVDYIVVDQESIVATAPAEADPGGMN